MTNVTHRAGILAGLATIALSAGCSAGTTSPANSLLPSGGARLASTTRMTPSNTCPAAGPGYNGGLTPDGDFNGAPLPGSVATYTNGNPIPSTNWNVTLRTIDLVGLTYWSNPGVCTVDLDGSPGAGEIAETFPTTPNMGYHVQFIMSGNGGAPPVIKRMSVTAAGQSYNFTWNTAGNNDAQHGVYQTKYWKFRARAATTTIRFRSLDRPPNTVIGGPVITEISVL